MSVSPQDFERQVHGARTEVLEQALLAFVEDVLGRVPSDDEIITKSFNVQFSDTPLSTYVKDGKRFTRYYVWGRQHCVAYGFLDTKRLIDLSIVRVPREEWPGALAAYVAQWNPPPRAL